MFLFSSRHYKLFESENIDAGGGERKLSASGFPDKEHHVSDDICSCAVLETCPPLWGSARGLYHFNHNSLQQGQVSAGVVDHRPTPLPQQQSSTNEAVVWSHRRESDVVPGLRLNSDIRAPPVKSPAEGTTSARSVRVSDKAIVEATVRGWKDFDRTAPCRNSIIYQPSSRRSVISHRRFTSGRRSHSRVSCRKKSRNSGSVSPQFTDSSRLQSRLQSHRDPVSSRSATSAPSRQNSLSSSEGSTSDHSGISVRSECSVQAGSHLKRFFNLPVLRIPCEHIPLSTGYGLGPTRTAHPSVMSDQHLQNREAIPGEYRQHQQCEANKLLASFFAEVYPKVLEATYEQCNGTSTPGPFAASRKSDTDRSKFVPSVRPALAILDFLQKKTNVKILAVDFDLTMTTRHSGGFVDIVTDVKGILDRLSQDFNVFASAANQRGFRIACVTFSDEKMVDGNPSRLAGKALVEAVMAKGGAVFNVEKVYGFFPMLYQQRESYQALGLSGPMPYCKAYHLDRVCHDFKVRADEILLVDDDIDNCRHAVQEGYLAIAVRGRRGFAFQDLASVRI